MQRWLLAAALLAPASAGAATMVLDRVELHLDHPVREAVFSIRTAEKGGWSLAAAGVNDDGEARLSVFKASADGRLPSTPSQTRALPDDIVALDSDGRSLYALEADKVNRWNPKTNALVPAAASDTLFRVRPPRELVPVGLLHDVDSDGDQDFVLPDFLGYRVLTQSDEGALAESALLRVRPIAHHQEYSERITYRPPPIYFVDATGDNVLDAVIVRGDELLVFRGKGSGGFGDPVRLALGIGVTESYLGDDMGDADIDHTSQVWRRVVHVGDFDGDRQPDLLTQTVESKGLFDKQHSLSLHRGRVEDGRLRIERVPTSHFATPVVLDDPEVRDINGDGKLDIAVWSVDFGLRKILTWLVTGDIEIDLAVYALGKDGRFDENPTRREQMDAAFDLSTGKPSVPPALLADLTGDGRTDLAIGEGEERLFVYAGNGSDEIFERKPLEIEVRLPGNGRDLVTAQDVDTNGADDVIIRYGRVDGSARRTTMQLLLSKPNEVVAGTQAR